MRVQLFEASTSYQLMVLAAAIDAGCFEPVDERLLLVSVNTPVPEVASRPDEAPGIDSLLGRFDRVLSLNDLLAPVHPAAFRPRQGEQPLFERLLRAAMGLPVDAAVELVVESVQAPPSRSLLNVFGGSAATVYAEGLMSYGPTRDPLPPQAGSRVRRVLHLDLVPGLEPLLLTEYGVPAEAVPADAFRAVVAEVAAAARPTVPDEPYALVLGQYLAQLGLLSDRAEAALMADLVRAAAAAGHRLIAVKPHPSAPPDALDAALEAAPGARVVLLTDPVPAEALCAVRPPELVLGCFSTGLVTAARYWSVPAASLGAERVLAALPRFEDSNRVPLAIVERWLPGADGRPAHLTDHAALQRFVRTVGYAMQWRAHPEWREDAAAALAEDPAAYAAAVPRERLRRLALPGGWPVALSGPAFARTSPMAERALGAGTALRRRLTR
ncbi:polysialyltransferase family glycosyltransferase [Amnibacterium endophyticum]|uniref:Polysialyltransferase family glycosyltransferase n=1 Tax=Amnibacterium endophyticum TaxID=2109337 RepID=A0ABW4LDX0_9MICO